MADITPLLPAGRQIIQSYGDGGFRIAGIQHQGNVLVLPSQTMAWPVSDIAAAELDSLAALLEGAAGLDLILFGCGASVVPLPPALRAGLRAQTIAAEPMDTGAACRTFNVLMAEERAVAAALIAVA